MKEHRNKLLIKLFYSLINFNRVFLSGGLSNYLYRCEIPAKYFNPIGNEPDKIFLRLYGENHHKNSSVILKDVVVNAIMSDYSLGPKLYGIFPAGRLEQLIPVEIKFQNKLYYKNKK